MFDPDKAERYFCYSSQSEFYADQDPTGDWVKASDYDKLLEIHHHHVKQIADMFKKCGEPLSEEKLTALKNGSWR